MEFIALSPSEKQILMELRTLAPFERLEIIADQTGKPGFYLISRSTKMLLTDLGNITYIKTRGTSENLQGT